MAAGGVRGGGRSGDDGPGEARRLREAAAAAGVQMARELDWGRAVDTAIRVAERALRADAVVLWRADADAQVLRLVAQEGMAQADVATAEVEYGADLLVARAVREQRVLAVERLDGLASTEDAVRLWEHLGFRGMGAVPLPGREDLAGAMVYLTRAPRRYRKAELAAIGSIGEVLGLGLETAWLHTQLNALLEDTPSAIATWSADPHGELRFRRVNPAFCQAAGLPREAIEGRGLVEVFPVLLWQDRPVLDLLWGVLRTGASMDVPELVVHGTAKGVTCWRAHFSPLRNPEGQVVGGIFAAEDISEDKQAEAEHERLLARARTANEELAVSAIRQPELAEQAERRAAELDATISAIADGVVIYDADGRIERMNAAADALLGFGPGDRALPLKERLAKRRVQTRDGKPFPVDQTPSARALRGEQVLGVIMVIQSEKGGRTWVSSSAGPIRSSAGRVLGAVATFTDVTRLHELQEQQEDMLRAVSHDLRTPLTVVQGQAQLLARLLEQAGWNGRLKQSTDGILTGARRMNRMIEELVESARLESGQVRLRQASVDMHAFVVELKERLAGALEAERIRVEAAIPLAAVWVDPNALERILTNLLTNSPKYAGPGTEVAVRLCQRGGEVVTEVKDRGPGIPPEEQERIFQRFARVRRTAGQREGLGLGLYITRRLVEAHGGRIWVESTPGQGSTVSFTLPAAGGATDR